MPQPTQLDRIEAGQASLAADLAGVRSLLQNIVTREISMATTVAEFAAQLDAATTAEAAVLATQSAKIDAVGAEIQSLFDRLQSAGTPQSVLDSLASSVSRLGGTSAALAAQGERLTAMAVDPTNPVPTPVPAPAP